MTAEPDVPSQPADLLVVGRWLVADAGERGILDGPIGVLVDGGRVVAIGAPEELRRHAPREEIGGVGSGVVPGLVNSHHHQSVTPFQRGVPDDRLEPWLVSQLGLPLLDPALDAWWGAVEMLRSGITTAVHNHAAAWLPAADPLGAARAIVDAYAATGLRVAFSVSARDQHPLVYGDDPPSCGAAVTPRTGASFGAETYPRFVRALAAHPSSDRVRTQVSIHNVQWCSDELATAVRALADELGTGVHLHVQESRAQLDYGTRRWGTSPIGHLDEIGFLGPDVSCAHAVWLDAPDAALLAERGVTVVHNPSSNLRLQSGIAPVAALRAAGVGVALGLDQAGLGDDQDLFTEMRLARGLSGVVDEGAPLGADDVFTMASSAGAATTGFGDAGRIEVGGAADLLVVDLDRPSSPWLHPDVRPLELVVQRVHPADLSHVVLEGAIRVRGGVVEGVDIEALRDEFEASIASAAGRADLTGARELADAVRRWFDEWALAGTARVPPT